MNYLIQIKIKFFVLLLCSIGLTACDNGSREPELPILPETPVFLPPTLEGVAAQVYIQGNLANLSLGNTGGLISSCEANNLPDGLVVAESEDGLSCNISGVPSTVLEAQSYAVEAVNATGSSQANVSIEVVAASEFVTVWKTDNEGMSEDNQITLTSSPDQAYNYQVDWGDGTSDENVTGDITHTYDSAGSYTISITGVFPQTYFPFTSDAQKLLSVEQWGNRQWLSMQRAYAGTDNIVFEAVDSPDLSQVTDMSFAFYQASFDQDISEWDVSKVTDMSSLFLGATIPVENYDALLNAWAELDLQTAVTLNVSSEYSAAAEEARRELTEDFGWDISDGGLADSSSTSSSSSSSSSSTSSSSSSTSSTSSSSSSSSSSTSSSSSSSSSTSSGQPGLVAPDLQSVVDQQFIQDNFDAFIIPNNGGEPDACSAKTLPEGLAISVSSDGASCTISGVPTTLLELGSFEVTAENALGVSEESIVRITVVAASRFVTLWDTEIPGKSDDKSIVISLAPEFNGQYDFEIQWGDGTADTVRGDLDEIRHSYPQAGEFTVVITGTFPQFYFPAEESDAPKLVSVLEWGNREWLSMKQAFYGCTNMTIDDEAGVPDLSRVEDMSYAFAAATQFDQEINDWDVSNVTNMAFMFSESSGFNQEIQDWDVSNVTDMQGMFYRNSVFNQALNNWQDRVSNVTNMSRMFALTAVFNQELYDWNVSSVTNMSDMFSGSLAFNQSIGSWDVGNVTDMSNMFAASVFNRSIGEWDVGNVTNMGRMFYRNTDFDQDIGEWDISNVENMEGLFIDAELSVDNYDALLNGWLQQVREVREVTLDVSSRFSINGAGSRNTLESTYLWKITDHGLNQPVSEAPILLDAEDQRYFTGMPVVLAFENTGGGSLDSCTSETLPEGLSVRVMDDLSSCVIEGIPTEKNSDQDQNYTVVAVNAAGQSEKATVYIEVDVSVPLLENVAEQQYGTGIPIVLTFKNNGGGLLSECSINPQLPSGLEVSILEDGSSCVISGNVEAAAEGLDYEITAVNEAGEGPPATVNLAFFGGPDLVSIQEKTFRKDFQDLALRFTNEGTGSLTSCSIDKDLPEGLELSINESGNSCLIRGVPTEEMIGLTEYKVVAVNAYGESTATVHLQVMSIPELVLAGTFILRIGQEVKLPFNNMGGRSIIECYSIQILPEGLEVTETEDDASCMLIGKPTGSPQERSIRVYARNPAGTSDGIARIQVLPQRPDLLEEGDKVYRVGERMSLEFTNTGGGFLTRCSMNSVPEGLTVSVKDESTCVLSGTPTRAITKKFHTMVAENAAGYGEGDLTIEVISASVNPPPPPPPPPPSPPDECPPRPAECF